LPLLDTERARARLVPLIRRHLRAEEDEATARLCRRIRAATRRGYLTASELEAACRWKSPRAIHHVRANTPRRIRAATAAAFGARREDARLQALLQLRGVSVPTASAVLMLANPRSYGVIDIRVWQLLHARGVVTRNAPGVGLGPGHWREFLGVIRYFARTLRLRARDVERALFDAHRARQKGRLYTIRKAKAR
jgi:hypothetical protein